MSKVVKTRLSPKMAKLKKAAEVKAIPTTVTNILMSATKREAIKFIMTYQEGIRKNDLNLEPLKPDTVKRKSKQGYSKPDTPLYGLGDDNEKSYINMNGLMKLKNGWKVYPRWAKHHKSSLELRQLLFVHEYGATIVTKTGKLIRIPPRPARLLAYIRYLREYKSSRRNNDVKRAITEYIQNANAEWMRIRMEKEATFFNRMLQE